MQPSSYDIQREVEALRDIRRRSTTPGALTIDPDLPNQSPPSSPTTTYWSPSANTSSSPSLIHDDSSSSSHSSSSETAGSTGDNIAAASQSHLTDDPFHLFWVPASLHPEIAPAEFRAFLKEHARAVPPADGSDASLERSLSTSSTSSGLARKRSMLSRQYKPSENDGVEAEEKIIPLSRNRSTMVNRGPQLTIKDLQKLEELAEEATTSDDPSKLRTMLRRSLSLNISPSAMEQMDNMPDMPDEADAPIIVPPPGQILRRAARTKIRKPGLPGDGGGHRFGSSRRGAPIRSQSASAALPKESRTSDDVSSSDHGEHLEAIGEAPSRSRSYSNETTSSIRSVTRPDSFSEEALIYEAYARDEEELHAIDTAPVLVTSPPTPTHTELPETDSPPPPSLLEGLGPVIHHPQPQRLLSPETSSEPTSYPDSSRTPSPPTPSPPDASPPHSSENLSVQTSPPSAASSFISMSPSPQRNKDKKSSLFKWGSDKSGKKNKDKDKDRDREKAEKEKDSGFFGNLFSSKKKQDDSSSHSSSSGRETAERLLGQSKRAPTSPSPILAANVPGGNVYARYPIHVERAIYRLSHIKLANPRRPLYEQVLISNLMFWYLGVINKAQAGPGAPQGPNGAQPSNANGPEGSEQESRERYEREQREREERENAERERAERERREREEHEREMEMKKKETPKRGPLTKPPAIVNGGRRAAEMPVKGPQYEMQHRVMEQEYGNYNNGGMSNRRPSSAPGHRQAHQAPPKLIQPQPQQSSEFYYNVDSSHQSLQRLPQGAMPPASVTNGDQPWAQTNSGTRQRGHSSPSPPPMMASSSSSSSAAQRRSRSPPPHNHSQPSLVGGMNSDSMSGGKLPGRSLSATAVPSPSPQLANGKPLRKGVSAHAVAPQPNNHRRPKSSEMNGAGDEDVPLAVWQQQRRK
ncbi:hypothetical protein ONZ45_g1603 [Pleurotus djamor]|nr:hypothetical protein ONZ45_g1603 [Pleurotus djamor]